ncbi:MAG: nucleoside triphosphate pyrophosphohydrolase [Parcubacteria group bacterium]|jgi:predicted house-cleaning noncanonical NTP pyrophosphatase (MazG superfamily)
MKKIFYRKLIRDNIPKEMLRAGAKFEVRKLGKKDFEKELLKKVGEEASGLLAAKNKKEIIEELADVLDVTEEIRRYWKINPARIREKQKENARRKGGFKEKTYLVWSEDTGYRTNEKKYNK